MGKLGVLFLAAGALVAASESFEVASVKPSAKGIKGYSFPPAKNGSYTAGNVSLKMLVGEAFHVQDYQVSGGPAWVEDERYDIVAKFAGTFDTARVRKMIQALLAERFQLTVHHQKKEMSIYALTLAKGGSKMKQAKDPACTASPVSPLCGGFQVRNRSQVTGESVSMEQLGDLLAVLLHCPVVDQTGISRVVDLHTEWAPDGVSNVGEADQGRAPGEGLSIFTAVQVQLGLKLAPQKGMVDQVVIDRAEKASAN